MPLLKPRHPPPPTPPTAHSYLPSLADSPSPPLTPPLIKRSSLAPTPGVGVSVSVSVGLDEEAGAAGERFGFGRSARASRAVLAPSSSSSSASGAKAAKDKGKSKLGRWKRDTMVLPLMAPRPAPTPAYPDRPPTASAPSHLTGRAETQTRQTPPPPPPTAGRALGGASTSALRRLPSLTLRRGPSSTSASTPSTPQSAYRVSPMSHPVEAPVPPRLAQLRGSKTSSAPSDTTDSGSSTGSGNGSSPLPFSAFYNTSALSLSLPGDKEKDANDSNVRPARPLTRLSARIEPPARLPSGVSDTSAASVRSGWDGSSFDEGEELGHSDLDWGAIGWQGDAYSKARGDGDGRSAHAQTQGRAPSRAQGQKKRTGVSYASEILSMKAVSLPPASVPQTARPGSPHSMVPSLPRLSAEMSHRPDQLVEPDSARPSLDGGPGGYKTQHILPPAELHRAALTLAVDESTPKTQTETEAASLDALGHAHLAALSMTLDERRRASRASASGAPASTSASARASLSLPPVLPSGGLGSDGPGSLVNGGLPPPPRSARTRMSASAASRAEPPLPHRAEHRLSVPPSPTYGVQRRPQKEDDHGPGPAEPEGRTVPLSAPAMQLGDSWRNSFGLFDDADLCRPFVSSLNMESGPLPALGISDTRKLSAISTSTVLATPETPQHPFLGPALTSPRASASAWTEHRHFAPKPRRRGGRGDAADSDSDDEEREMGVLDLVVGGVVDSETEAYGYTAGGFTYEYTMDKEQQEAASGSEGEDEHEVKREQRERAALSSWLAQKPVRRTIELDIVKAGAPAGAA